MSEQHPKLKVPKELIAHYLGDFVNLTEQSDPEDEFLSELGMDCAFTEIKIELLNKNEQIYLAAGLKKLIDYVAPKDYINYSSQEESLTSEDMKFLVKKLYEKTRPAGFENTSAEITNESLDDFRIAKGIYYRSEKGDTLASISEKLSIPLSTIVENNTFLTRKYSTTGSLPISTVFPIKLAPKKWIPTE